VSDSERIYVYRPYALVKYNSVTDEFAVDWDWSESLQGYTDENGEYHDEDRILTPHAVDADVMLHRYLLEKGIRD